jgi:hypothetical protein
MNCDENPIFLEKRLAAMSIKRRIGNTGQENIVILFLL